MKYPVIIVLFGAFCLFAWHTVENGINVELREEVSTLHQQVSDLTEQSVIFDDQVTQFKDKLVNVLPEQGDEIELLFIAEFAKGQAEEQLAEEE